MKALSILAAGLLVASGAMADQGRPSGGNGGQSCTTCPEINVGAPLIQVTSIASSNVKNKADDGAVAKQNIASNAGNVTIKASTIQAAVISDSNVTNTAYGNPFALATQSIATNIGKVNVNGSLLQVAAIASSTVSNKASSNSIATQNISTNNGCSACN